MPKLIAMMRVKDGILFIDKWLERMDALVDEIVVVDNGSTDGTLEILEKHPKVVSIDRTVGFDEGRDKVLAYQRVRERKPDWVLWLDVDEIFEDRLTRDMLDKMMSSKIFTCYSFRRFHFHKDYNHFEARLDKLLSIAVPDRKMWKEQPTGYFANLKIHNGLIRGIKGPMRTSNIRIKHLGAVDPEYLIRKTNIYLAVDPANREKYVHNRDQQVPTWQWYEYSKAPLIVQTQNLILNILCVFSLLKFSCAKLVRSLRRFLGPNHG